MSSFKEMEIRGTVALDGGTRRACNNENCSQDYQHKGKCDDGTVEAEKMFNLLQQAKKTISAVGHRIPCGFSGCTCGAVNTFKLESAEFWRQVQEIESGWPAAPQKGKP